MDATSLIAPAFFAGILMFLAPCTLPLVPAFLGFLGGAHGGAASSKVRRRVFLNALLYVTGFTAVFVSLGTAFGIGGAAIAAHRQVLTRIGGVFVVLFGLSMTGILSMRFLEKERRFRPTRMLKPGNPLSAFVFGATFALGWSPCIGPVLGSILLLASSSATAVAGASLLLVFSAGLGLPFLVLAAAYGHAAQYTKTLSRALPAISKVGGGFLVVLGALMVSDHMDVWLQFAYSAFHGLGAKEALLRHF